MQTLRCFDGRENKSLRDGGLEESMPGQRIGFVITEGVEAVLLTRAKKIIEGESRIEPIAGAHQEPGGKSARDAAVAIWEGMKVGKNGQGIGREHGSGDGWMLGEAGG